MLLVDAANVVGSRPTGWWRDRAGAAQALVERVRAATRSSALPTPVAIVLEGAARKGVAPGTEDGVEVVHARGEGDETIAAMAAMAAAAREPVTLVSADRELGRRARLSGANVVGPSWLLDRLPETAEPR